MKKKIIFLFVILLICNISSYSQGVTNLLIDGKNIETFDLRSNNLIGSNYINDNFLPAKLSNSEEIYLVKYNAHMDEMEIDKNGKPFHLAKNFNYSISFTGINKNYQVFEYADKKTNKRGFFVVLSKSKDFSLLLKEQIKFYKEVKAKTGYDKYKAPRLERVKDKLLIGYINNTTTEFPKKEKDFFNLFSSNAKEVESYSKKNKLNFKNKEDLNQIFEYYNTLQ